MVKTGAHLICLMQNYELSYFDMSHEGKSYICEGYEIPNVFS